MSNTEYKPAEYWSEVGERVDSREDSNIIAGDDEPFYYYKREEFLKLLDEVDLGGKSVLEVGPGPGGNLKFLRTKHSKKPNKVTGADISTKMVSLATRNNENQVEIVHFNGVNLPFNDNTFDTIFTATVLQHNTDEKMFTSIVSDICRVASKEVYLFERIEKTPKGDELNQGRTVQQYTDLFAKGGFTLASKKFINIQISYLVCGAIRILLNPKTREEGQPLTKFSLFLQNITLPITKVLDKIFTADRDLCRLHFVKKS